MVFGTAKFYLLLCCVVNTRKLNQPEKNKLTSIFQVDAMAIDTTEPAEDSAQEASEPVIPQYNGHELEWQGYRDVIPRKKQQEMDIENISKGLAKRGRGYPEARTELENKFRRELTRAEKDRVSEIFKVITQISKHTKLTA